MILFIRKQRSSTAITIIYLLLLVTTIKTTSAIERIIISNNRGKTNIPIRSKTTVSSSLSPNDMLLDNNNKNQQTNNFNNDYDSSILRELKETIQKQALEIESLKRQQQQQKTISSTTIHHGGGGGHGGSSSSNTIGIDEMIQYIHRPFYYIAIQRVGWLGLFMISLSCTAIIMNEFEHIIQQHVELAFFVPFLAGHGGNTGGQTVGTVLSALSANVITNKDAPKVIIKEAMSGCMMGLLLGSIVAPLAHYGMGISQHVSTVIWFTIPLVSTIAATLGSSIPFVCLALGLNPSVIAAPAMTSLVDVSGLLSYFLIASKIFHAFGINLK